MQRNTPSILAALLLVVAVVGCEDGPAGPAGASGTTGTTGEGLVAFGEIDGTTFPSTIERAWPSNLTVTISELPAQSGVWGVTLQGNIPQGVRGVVLATATGTDTDAALSTFITQWDPTQARFEVRAWSTDTGNVKDIRFTYVILGE